MPEKEKSSEGKIDIFLARKIITMNPSWPEATAIAVRDGHILEVGSLETLKPWMERFDFELIRTFEDRIILPGFIDPHLHPMMAAVLLPMHFITAMEWQFPWGKVEATTSPEAWLERLSNIEANMEPGEPLFSWGYHGAWHGKISRSLLNQISDNRPVLVWQRSFHELYMNDAMIRLLALDESALKGRYQIDIENGHFFENGLGYAINKLNPIIMSDEWISDGLRRLKEVVQFGGHTTIGDMAVGLFDFEKEWQAAQTLLENAATPFRVLCVPHALRVTGSSGDHQQALKQIESLPETNTHRFRFTRRVKLFTDGAFFSQLAVLKDPGYLDGHLGEWLMTPADFEAAARVYWLENYAIHVHCTGDMGVELALDTLEKLQQEKPRFDHGFTIEHFGFSTPEQVEKIKRLGASVSANVYYLHELSDIYAQQAVGVERAYQMGRVGSCVSAGITTALHSDFPMAPASPLVNAWVACTRRNAIGEVVAENEKLGVHQALKAVTLDAARILGLDDEVGSLRSGKKADMVVLDRDPYEAGAEGLKEITVCATIFEGSSFPLP